MQYLHLKTASKPVLSIHEKGPSRAAQNREATIHLVLYLELARQAGAGTAQLDGLIETYRSALPIIGERDLAAMVELLEMSPLAGHQG